jgi:hypothetical protein
MLQPMIRTVISVSFGNISTETARLGELGVRALGAY